MMVKDLIEKLKKIKPETELFMASDAEGNGYHTIDDINRTGKPGIFILYPNHDDIDEDELFPQDDEEETAGSMDRF